jgi:hypothetical protein
VVGGDATIYANNGKVASVRQVLSSGFVLKPGSYSLAVKNSAGQIVLRKANVEIRKGEVKTVELTR